MNWLRQLAERRRLERDLAAEIAQHLDEKTEELVAAGLAPRAARAAARRAFGSVALAEERSRDVWHWRWIEDLWGDLRYGVRQLRRTPSFTLAAVVTLALGIGINTAIFSFVHAIVLKPLAFPDPDRLVSVESLDIRDGPHPVNLAYQTFFEFRRAGVFEHITSYRDEGLTLTGRDVPVQLDAQIVSADFFATLGVRPGLGRGFLSEEERPGTRVVVLGHETWVTHFASNPGIVGQSIPLGGTPYTVVGVAPAGFSFPIRDRPIQIWTTLAVDAGGGTVVPLTEQRGARVLDAIARLRPGMSIEEAHARLDGVAAALARERRDTNGNQPATYVKPELERMLGPIREALLMLWGAVGLVLLIACANLANMLLARTADRDRELAVRLAIGGSRSRVFRQLLTENVLLASIGAAAGLVVAFGLISALGPLALERLPRASEIALDTRVLGFTLALTLVTSILVSVPVARWIRRLDISPSHSTGARGSTDGHERLRGTLVVGQLAVGLVLLCAASLLAGSFLHLTGRDNGFRPDGLVKFQIALPERYDVDGQVAFIDRLLERLRGMPGVSAAAAAMPLPLEGNMMSVSFNIVERPSEPGKRPQSNMALVSPGYFATIGTPVLEGRDFSDLDDETRPRVLVVNRAFAQKFFPGQSAIGKRIEPGATSNRDTRTGGSKVREIVGIVGNARQESIGREPEPIYYFPYKQLPWGPPSLIVRSGLDGNAVEADLRRLVASLEADAPVHGLRSFARMKSSGIALPQLLALLMGTFAVTALMLTATGLYGVLSYSVMRRTREIGVRLALGASRGGIVSMVMKRALLLMAIGVPAGSAGALVAQRLLRGLVFSPEQNSAWLLASAIAVVAATSLVAASLPALRAASVDPVNALRAE